MELSEPTTLVKLPHPGLVQGGRTRFAQVYGINAGVKRKRPEICTCIDGNSVNIYETAGGRNVSSVAVPPDSRFLCRPSSVRIRSSPDQSSRLTCCVIERRNRVSINRYLEAVADGRTTTSVSECVLQDSRRQYCHLELLGKDEAVVLAEDGHGILVSFSKAPYTEPFQLSTRFSSPTYLDARVVGSKDATTSVLKSRPDLTSKVLGVPHTIIAAFTYTDNQLKGRQRIGLGVWPLDTASTSLSLNPHQPVLEHELPESFDADTRLTVTLDDTASTVMIATDAMSLAYDLTTIQPQKLYSLPSDGLTDIIQISRHLQVRAKTSSLELVNTAYDSLLSTCNASKRKRGGGTLAVKAFVAYISQQKRILAFSQPSQTVLAIDIVSSDSGPRHVSSLLANLGRGSSKRHKGLEMSTVDCSIGIVIDSTTSDDAWSTAELGKLTKLADAKGGVGFEAAFIDQVMHNDVEGTRSLPEAVLDLLLLAIFGFDHEMTEIDWVRPESCPLRVRMMCPRLLKWCAVNGRLTNTRLHGALKRSPALSPAWFPQSAIGIALVQGDSSLYLTHLYLEFVPHLDPESLGTLLRQLIRSLINDLDTLARQLPNGSTQQPSLGGPKQIPTPASPTYDNDAIRLVSEKTTNESPATHCLVQLLHRLASTGQENTSKQISNMLNPAEIQTLIQFLRQQLFQGGHTRSSETNTNLSPYNDAPREWWMTGTKLSLSATVTSLNACIDAIGPAGLFGATGEEEFVQTLLSDLNSEVSLACQAVEEATLLNGIMRELLRYAESVERRHEDEGDQESERLKGGRRGEIITIYAEPVNGESGYIPKSSLPLSLQAEGEMDPIKARKGGGQSRKRSGRETAMLKHRARAEYTLERVAL